MNFAVIGTIEFLIVYWRVQALFLSDEQLCEVFLEFI